MCQESWQTMILHGIDLDLSLYVVKITKNSLPSSPEEKKALTEHWNPRVFIFPGGHYDRYLLVCSLKWQKSEWSRGMVLDLGYRVLGSRPVFAVYYFFSLLGSHRDCITIGESEKAKNKQTGKCMEAFFQSVYFLPFHFLLCRSNAVPCWGSGDLYILAFPPRQYLSYSVLGSICPIVPRCTKVK